METIIINNNNILTLLLDEENEDNIIFSNVVSTKKNHTNKIFKNRANEGFFEILINRHLNNDEIKFCDFFRDNRNQFDFLLSLVEKELTVQPTNVVSRPITPAEKLAVTLR